MLTTILCKDQPGYIGGCARMVSDLNEICTICVYIYDMKKNNKKSYFRSPVAMVTGKHVLGLKSTNLWYFFRKNVYISDNMMLKFIK